MFALIFSPPSVYELLQVDGWPLLSTHRYPVSAHESHPSLLSLNHWQLSLELILEKPHLVRGLYLSFLEEAGFETSLRLGVPDEQGWIGPPDMFVWQ